MEKNKAASGEVKEDEGEKAYRFTPEIAVDLQKRSGHDGLSSHTHWPLKLHRNI